MTDFTNQTDKNLVNENNNELIDAIEIKTIEGIIKSILMPILIITIPPILLAKAIIWKTEIIVTEINEKISSITLEGIKETTIKGLINVLETGAIILCILGIAGIGLAPLLLIELIGRALEDPNIELITAVSATEISKTILKMIEDAELADEIFESEIHAIEPEFNNISLEIIVENSIF